MYYLSHIEMVKLVEYNYGTTYCIDFEFTIVFLSNIINCVLTDFEILSIIAGNFTVFIADLYGCPIR